MKLSKKDIRAIESLVGSEDSSQPHWEEAMSKKMRDALTSVAKRAQTSIENLPSHSLRQSLDNIFWRYKLDWPGGEEDYAKVFSKAFEPELKRLMAEKKPPILPGVDAPFSSTSAPAKPASRKPRKPKAEAIAEAQGVEEINTTLSQMSADMAGKKTATVSDGQNPPTKVSKPRCKITDDNFFRIFTEVAPNTLIPIVAINLVKEPIVDIEAHPGNKYVLRTANQRIVSVLFPQQPATQMPVAEQPDFADDPIEQVIAPDVSSKIDVMPDDIVEVL